MLNFVINSFNKKTSPDKKTNIETATTSEDWLNVQQADEDDADMMMSDQAELQTTNTQNLFAPPTLKQQPPPPPPPSPLPQPKHQSLFNVFKKTKKQLLNKKFGDLTMQNSLSMQVGNPVSPPPPPPPPPGGPKGTVKLIEFPDSVKVEGSGNGTGRDVSASEEERGSSSKKAPELGAVVVTIFDDASYDDLFRSIPQKGEDGEVVRVYQCAPDYLELLVECLKTGANASVDDRQRETHADILSTIRSICEDINELNDPEAVVFNYECCQGCDAMHFSLLDCCRRDIAGSNKKSFEHIHYFLSRGFMVMCSDFSLKALISNWDAEKLGPNPFKMTEQTYASGRVKLRFNPSVLKDCPSSQLQTVGELLPDKDWLYCNTLGGTINYTVVDDRYINQRLETTQMTSISETPNDGSSEGQGQSQGGAGGGAGDSSAPYALQILTIAELHTHVPCTLENEKGEKLSGAAGHCLLTYPGGGKLLTSMTHWVELVKLEATEEQVFEKARSAYGAQYATSERAEYDMLGDETSKKAWLRNKSCQFVQQSAPAMSKVKKQKQKLFSAPLSLGFNNN
eukprot:CAMPEP_0197846498 /NCGR_PEP_ID=MMETSP1438-20131217/3233_1 /TAXON_ID=1461541 /ORGANISM="Pterosperma sp., Strain CCMP1384" /LENGTH=567 /DNA_ID=CAMNT_0043458171 /DNA_START=210 /DNA_END=1913 /DNA_ORIENTATION=+